MSQSPTTAAGTPTASKDASYAADNNEANPVVEMDARDHNGLVVGKWKAGVFDCFEHLVPNCLMSTFCPCVTVAQVAHRIGMYTFKNVLLVWGGFYLLFLIFYIIQMASFPSTQYIVLDGSWGYRYTGSMLWIWLAIACNVVAFILLLLFRIKFRRAFKIPGSELEDCCCSYWCSCCVYAQMASHAESYTPGECNFGPKDTLPGYTF
ncbi:hypothetical protein AeNC1_010005 [Aphanomyces euteiches]|nr:hypothetical protein AeNC1_010005 [Aphanomyces euteiches]